jgi:hypothetical protein
VEMVVAAEAEKDYLQVLFQGSHHLLDCLDHDWAEKLAIALSLQYLL